MKHSGLIFLALALDAFSPGFGAPPALAPSTLLQSRAVFLGKPASFWVTASGDAPLAYQWHLDGTDLLNETNSMLRIANTRVTDEGDYTVRVRNGDGSVISDPLRLWVVPLSTKFIKGNFTNGNGQRLPYFYTLPTHFDPARTYPLVCLFHGLGGDEASFPDFASSYAWTATFASYGQQEADPAILVWPTRRVGEGSWTDSYLVQVSGLVDELIGRFNIDTNRLYVGGGSEGVHAAWDLIGLRPGRFAAALVAAGWQGNTRASIIKDQTSVKPAKSDSKTRKFNSVKVTIN